MQVQSRCRHCGSAVVLDAAVLTLLVPAEGLEQVKAVFDCPVCELVTSVVIDGRLATVLEVQGARTVRRHPALMSPRSRPGDGAPPFTPDDVLDFHELLERPDWFEHLLGSG